jgi:hypothetical protein
LTVKISRGRCKTVESLNAIDGVVAIALPPEFECEVHDLPDQTKVFYIDVGNMPPARAKEYLKELSESDTLKVGQNYYVARSSSGKFTEIRYLDDVK